MIKTIGIAVIPNDLSNVVNTGSFGFCGSNRIECDHRPVYPPEESVDNKGRVLVGTRDLSEEVVGLGKCIRCTGNVKRRNGLRLREAHKRKERGPDPGRVQQ